MKPASFDYHAPERLEDVLELLADAEQEVRVIAGGQSLVPMMNFRLAVPEVLVDLRRVEGLGRIEVDAGGTLEIGATVTQSQLLRDPRVEGGWPLLHEGVSHVGHPQIRSRGTVCGSLAHHDPHGELPALAVALGAELTVAGPAGRRTIKAEDFFVSYYEVALEPGELLVAARFPAPAPGTGWGFAEIARRRGDFALVGVACVLPPAADPRLAFFGVGDRPILVTDPAATAEAVAPLDDLHASAEYRREVAVTLAERVVAEAKERGGA
jgi:aerobic carbon-monoxide dehydrogenase medium subunit